jgi:transposase
VAVDPQHLLRPAQPSDADSVTGLLATLGYPDEVPRVRDRLERLTAREEAGVLVAEVGGAVSALAAYQVTDLLERGQPLVSVRPRCEHLFVPSSRRMHMEKNRLAALVGEGLSLAQIGERVGRDPSTVSYWMKRYGLEAVHRDKHAARGGIDREVLAQLVDAAMTVRQIAAAVDRSTSTVRHWLREYGLETSATARRRTPLAAGDRRDGVCRTHGATQFVGRPDGSGWRCVRCRAERVVARRRRVKAILVAEAGGKCVLCGYDRCLSALEFHHLDPSQKRFSVASRGAARSLQRVREEVAKCVLLCSNCHAEVEAGVAAIQDRQI